MNTPEAVERCFKRRIRKKIVQTGIQSTQVMGNPDHPEHPEKWVLIDFDDRSFIRIRIALTDDGPTVLSFEDSLDQ